MPEARATLRFLRTSPYKVRKVLELVRGRDVQAARDVLRFSNRGAARDVRKVLESAVANAEHNLDMPGDELYVARCWADEGLTLRRFRPRARGRVGRIRKRTSHVTIVVDRRPEEELETRRARAEAMAATRGARVEASRRARDERAKTARAQERPVAGEAEPVREEAEAEAAEEEAETGEAGEAGEEAEAPEAPEAAEAEEEAEAAEAAAAEEEAEKGEAGEAGEVGAGEAQAAAPDSSEGAPSGHSEDEKD